MRRFDNWESELCHFGILGMKWGVCRYQNPDGTLTPEGVARYGAGKDAKYLQKALNRNLKQYRKSAIRSGELNAVYNGTKSSRKKAKLEAEFNLVQERKASADKKNEELVTRASENGYHIDAKAKLFRVRTQNGKQRAGRILAGAAAGAGLGYLLSKKSFGKKPTRAVLSMFGNATVGAVTGAVVNRRRDERLLAIAKAKVRAPKNKN